VIKSIETNYGLFNFYDKYVVAIIHEGVDLNEVLIDDCISLMQDFYGVKRPFAYITHRIHSYSVNPLIYLKVSQVPNLAAFAVVSNKMFDTFNIQIEKAFNTKPHELFGTLSEAINWAVMLVDAADKN